MGAEAATRLRAWSGLRTAVWRRVDLGLVGGRCLRRGPWLRMDLRNRARSRLIRRRTLLYRGCGVLLHGRRGLLHRRGRGVLLHGWRGLLLHPRGGGAPPRGGGVAVKGG